MIWCGHWTYFSSAEVSPEDNYDYLLHHTLSYETIEGEQSKAVEADQGSILGLDAWNVCYDSFLTDLLEQSVLVEYTDNVAALIAARNVELAQLKPHTIKACWFTVSLVLNKTDFCLD